MYNGKKILAIIPARGGSKGIPHKNIVSICGQPLIAYTITEAIKSQYIDKLIVSTDDEEIAETAKQFGAEVPFMRPVALGQDSTPGIDPILHAMDWFRQRKIVYNYVLCLQCTSPLRTFNQIDEAIEQLIDQGADSMVSVCESKVSPFWMKRINEGNLVDFLPNMSFYARRQEAPTVYQLNGALYLAREDILRTNNNWYTKQTLPYVMDEISSLDIDSQMDLQFFEFLEGRKRK